MFFWFFLSRFSLALRVPYRSDSFLFDFVSVSVAVCCFCKYFPVRRKADLQLYFFDFFWPVPLVRMSGCAELTSERSYPASYRAGSGRRREASQAYVMYNGEKVLLLWYSLPCLFVSHHYYLLFPEASHIYIRQCCFQASRQRGRPSGGF